MRIIDQGLWPRRQLYDFFKPYTQPFYSVTFRIDATNFYRYVKRNDISFYYGMVYASTEVLNSIEAFRYKIRGENIVLHDALEPSFTDLTPGSECFHITTLHQHGSMKEFSDEAFALSRSQSAFINDNDIPLDAQIYYTCTPWFSFTALTNERNADPDDSVPRIAWGKYEQQDGRLMLPYSLELNHKLVDGYHIGQFYERLQHYLDILK
ncbi:MAG: CatA-like O-acetyltransferase [Clostridia bacterium]